MRRNYIQLWMGQMVQNLVIESKSHPWDGVRVREGPECLWFPFSGWRLHSVVGELN